MGGKVVIQDVCDSIVYVRMTCVIYVLHKVNSTFSINLVEKNKPINYTMVA